MNLKKYDHIKIPDQLDQFVDKGLAKGKAHMESKSSFSLLTWKNKRFAKLAASIALVGGITLTTISNVPILAQELENVPVIGKLVKVLNFGNGSDSGGDITDGTTIGTQPISENTVDIFFKLDNAVTDFVPYYNVEYKEYPYKLVFEFHGVRDFDLEKTKKDLSTLPHIEDVYQLITLDDSAHRFVVEFSKDIDVSVSEYQEPGKIQITTKVKEEKLPEKEAYFARTKSAVMDEQFIHFFDEALIEHEQKDIQKDEKGTFVIQFGPYKTEEQALQKLKEIPSDLVKEQGMYIEKRKAGERPQ